MSNALEEANPPHEPDATPHEPDARPDEPTATIAGLFKSEANWRWSLWILCAIITISGVLTIWCSRSAPIDCGNKSPDYGVSIAYLVVGAILILLGSIVGLLNRLMSLTVLARVSETTIGEAASIEREKIQKK